VSHTAAALAGWHARHGGRWEFAGGEISAALIAELDDVAELWHDMPAGPGYHAWLPHDLVHFVVERHSPCRSAERLRWHGLSTSGRGQIGTQAVVGRAMTAARRHGGASAAAAAKVGDRLLRL
jgi:hypothetical protein